MKPLFAGLLASLASADVDQSEVRRCFDAALAEVFPPLIKLPIESPLSLMTEFEKDHGDRLALDSTRSAWWAKMRVFALQTGRLSDKQAKTVNDIAFAIAGKTILV